MIESFQAFVNVLCESGTNHDLLVAFSNPAVTAGSEISLFGVGSRSGRFPPLPILFGDVFTNASTHRGKESTAARGAPPRRLGLPTLIVAEPESTRPWQRRTQPDCAKIGLLSASAFVSDG